MRKTFKRSLALVLAMLMLLSVSPMGFAYADPKTCKHNYAYNAAVPAQPDTNGCKDGNIEYYYCEKCNSYFVEKAGGGFTPITYAETVVPAHKFESAPKFSWDPDDQNGYTSTADFKCTICNQTVSVPAVVTSVVTKPSSCTVEGIRTYTATVKQDGKTYTGTHTDAIPFAEHEFVHHDAAEPNCVADGNIEYYSCKNCDKVFLDKNPETETTDAYVHEGKLKKDSEYADRTSHTEAEKPQRWSFDEQGNKIRFDCMKGGKEYKVCTVCKAEYSAKDIAATTHSNQRFDEVPATCLKTGLEAYTACGICGSPWTERKVTDALGHKGKKVEAKDPTCLQPGNVEYWECTRCDAVADNENMDNPVYDVKDKDGKVIEKAVDVAGFSIPAAEHNLKFVSARKDPDCINKGVAKVLQCQNEDCKKYFMEYNKGDEIPDDAFVNEVGMPTYKDYKDAEHYYKQLSGKDDSAKTLPAAGHIWVKDMTEGSVGYVAPTCSKEGSCIATCPNCKATKTVKLDKVPHTIKAGSEAVYHKRTCEKDAYNVYICEKCNSPFEVPVENPTDDEKATGHNYAQGKDVIVEPTCNKDGVKGKKCLNEGCDSVIDKEPITTRPPHKITAVPAVDASCTKEGVKAHYICTQCQTTFSDAAGKKVVDVATLSTPKTAHVDKDNDNLCDVCKTVMNGCDHICHKTDPMSKIIWFIANLWYQYLGINQYCKCKLPHYTKAKNPLN